MSKTVSLMQFWLNEHQQLKVLMWAAATSLTFGFSLLLWKRPVKQIENRIEESKPESVQQQPKCDVNAQSTLMVMKVRKVQMAVTSARLTQVGEV